MTGKRLLILVCAVAVVVAFGAGAKKNKKNKAASPTSKNIAYAEYGEQLGRVALIVGSYAASFQEADKHFALQVAVGVNKVGPELEIDAKAFVLIDPDGNAYAMSLPAQIEEESALIGFTQQLNKEQPLVTDDFFTNLARTGSNFYGLGGQLTWTKVSLSYDSYFEDVIFFPKPTSGFDGVFTLHFFTPGMDGSIQVKFEIPKADETKKTSS